MIKVNPRARRGEDRNGDPLDGLVNLFDLGIVLSVGFLIAALSSLKLASSLTDGHTGGQGVPPDAIVVPSGATLSPLPTTGVTVAGQGTQVGEVYRLKDGRLVYVVPPPSGTPSAIVPPTP